MAGSPVGPVLSADETRQAEALLASAWGERAGIRGAQLIWGRRHIVRLDLGPGRSVVLKRQASQHRGDGTRARSFRVELATLEYLNAMPVPVAPRLLAADPGAGILLMEDLGAGASLADSLLAGDRARAEADLTAYARGLGTVHAWSIRRPGGLSGLLARYAPGTTASPAWVGAVATGKDAFLGVAGALGLPAVGVAAEIDDVAAALTGPRYAGLVHGDACPDNVLMQDGSCRIFDFETSGLGTVALDAAYLVAPFPSCWCFASLPAEVAAPAVAAYRACLGSAGVELGPDWDAATAAALAAWIVARGRVISRVLDEDRQWGTMTMRPRLLTWLASFTGAADQAGVFPRLSALAGALHEQLSRRWPGTAAPEYPALARPGSIPLSIPEWWPPAQ